MDRIAALLQQQCGVISRSQVLERGLDDAFLARAVRRRLLARVVDGVYVDHTGPLTWHQRAWAALLFYAPAVLTHESALRAEGMRRSGPEEGPIHVAIEHCRRVARIDGVVVHRKRGLARQVHPSRSPARIRLEEAVLDVAASASSIADAIALLSDACQTRRTTAARLLISGVARPRLRRRATLLAVLRDVADGAYSLLEHRYLTRVERPHGLPTGKRQRRVRIGRWAAYRDVEYLRLGTVIELDGRLGHEDATDRWDDLDRDLDGIVVGKLTVRLGWRHVLEPCRVAAAIATILRARGWTGQVTGCSPTCPADRGVLPSPAVGTSPRTRAG